jgi:hypothetical protein
VLPQRTAGSQGHRCWCGTCAPGCGASRAAGTASRTPRRRQQRGLGTATPGGRRRPGPGDRRCGPETGCLESRQDAIKGGRGARPSRVRTHLLDFRPRWSQPLSAVHRGGVGVSRGSEPRRLTGGAAPALPARAAEHGRDRRAVRGQRPRGPWLAAAAWHHAAPPVPAPPTPSVPQPSGASPRPCRGWLDARAARHAVWGERLDGHPMAERRRHSTTAAWSTQPCACQRGTSVAVPNRGAEHHADRPVLRGQPADRLPVGAGRWVPLRPQGQPTRASTAHPGPLPAVRPGGLVLEAGVSRFELPGAALAGATPAAS